MDRFEGYHYVLICRISSNYSTHIHTHPIDTILINRSKKESKEIRTPVEFDLAYELDTTRNCRLCWTLLLAWRETPAFVTN